MQAARKKCFPDINADLGERIGNDAEIMPYISSCNIACGGHAGDWDSIRATVDLARANRVTIGAHPAYPDRENFGRKHIDMAENELVESVLWQIRQIQSYVSEVGESLHHIKLHGALYNDAAIDPALASVILDLLITQFPAVSVYAPFGSQLANLGAKKGVTVMHEVFSDRRYQDDYTLVPRTFPNACIQEWKEIQQQAEDMVRHHRVRTVTGNFIPIQADTICVHGDHPEAIYTAMMLHKLFCEPYAAAL